MFGPLRITRLLAAGALAGVLAAAAIAGTHPGSPARIAPPCSPDGVCLPRYETWGWYQTHWRPFPTDTLGATPTPAGGKKEAGAGGEEEEIKGPSLPEPQKEGETGPKKRRGGGAAGGASTTPAPTLPEGTPPVGPEQTPPGLPPIEGAPAEGAPQPGLPAGPGTNPIPAPTTDPFGTAPPRPPAWMVENASYTTPPTAGAVVPASTPSIQDSPNLKSDDAPPALPFELQGLFGAASIRPTWSQAAAATTLAQPPSQRIAARPTARQGVVQTSAETPLGIQLINPASALSVNPGEGGLQQAIYFEATDQAAGAAVQLPPVVPAN